MATVVVGCMCVQSTVVEGTYIMQKMIYCLRQSLHNVTMATLTNRVQSCAKFDAHTHYYCQVITSNTYYLRQWRGKMFIETGVPTS